MFRHILSPKMFKTFSPKTFSPKMHRTPNRGELQSKYDFNNLPSEAAGALPTSCSVDIRSSDEHKIKALEYKIEQMATDMVSIAQLIKGNMDKTNEPPRESQNEVNKPTATLKDSGAITEEQTQESQSTTNQMRHRRVIRRNKIEFERRFLEIERELTSHSTSIKFWEANEERICRLETALEQIQENGETQNLSTNQMVNEDRLRMIEDKLESLNDGVLDSIASISTPKPSELSEIKKEQNRMKSEMQEISNRLATVKTIADVNTVDLYQIMENTKKTKKQMNQQMEDMNDDFKTVVTKNEKMERKIEKIQRQNERNSDRIDKLNELKKLKKLGIENSNDFHDEINEIKTQITDTKEHLIELRVSTSKQSECTNELRTSVAAQIADIKIAMNSAQSNDKKVQSEIAMNAAQIHDQIQRKNNGKFKTYDLKLATLEGQRSAFKDKMSKIQQALSAVKTQLRDDISEFDSKLQAFSINLATVDATTRDNDGVVKDQETQMMLLRNRVRKMEESGTKPHKLMKQNKHHIRKMEKKMSTEIEVKLADHIDAVTEYIGICEKRQKTMREEIETGIETAEEMKARYAAIRGTVDKMKVDIVNSKESVKSIQDEWQMLVDNAY